MRERAVVMVGLVLSARLSSPNGAPLTSGHQRRSHSSHRPRDQRQIVPGIILEGHIVMHPCHLSARSHVWMVRRRSHAPPPWRHQRAAHHRNRTSVPA